MSISTKKKKYFYGVECIGAGKDSLFNDNGIFIIIVGSCLLAYLEYFMKELETQNDGQVNHHVAHKRDLRKAFHLIP